jgi:hypothetical protein
MAKGKVKLKRNDTQVLSEIDEEDKYFDEFENNVSLNISTQQLNPSSRDDKLFINSKFILYFRNQRYGERA